MEIKITVVVIDEKANMIPGREKEGSIIVTHDSSMTVMSGLLKYGLISGSFCGERGDCGRCRVQFIQGTITPASLEGNALTAEELRQNYRLACLYGPKDDCVIRLAFEKREKY